MHNLTRSSPNVGIDLKINFSPTGIINSFSLLTVTQAFFIFTAGPMILSAIFSCYTWLVGLFSIPIFIFDAAVVVFSLLTINLAKQLIALDVA